MIENDLLQLGIGATAAVLLVREVLNFLKTKSANGHKPSYPEWERWRAVEDAIRAHTAQVQKNTDVLVKLSHDIEEMRREVENVKSSIEK